MKNHGTDLRACSKKQLIDMQSQAGLAYAGLPATITSRILADKTGFRSHLLRLAIKEYGLSEKMLEQFRVLRGFFREVFNLSDTPMEGIYVPEIKGFEQYMVVPKQLSARDILRCIEQKWGVNPGKFHNLHSLYENLQNLERSSNHARPVGDYAFSHVGGPTPDKVHLGKTYVESLEEGFDFMSLKEFLLATAFNKYTKGEFFVDTDGATITSTLFSAKDYPSPDMVNVSASWRETDSLLWIGNHSKITGYGKTGPRQIIIGYPV
jgi:hypothetical protein